jgi:hypothetical protein
VLASQPAPAPPSACLNCGAALDGRFCGHCGQRVVALDVSLRELVHEGVHEFVHLDGRILSTLRLLLRHPGRLTAELLAGRRARYIAPIRLYLVASLVFFLVLSAVAKPPAAVPHEQAARDRDLVTQPEERGFKIDLKRGTTRVLGDPAAFFTKVFTTAPKAAFVLVPAFALLTMLAFRQRVRFFVPHLYFALHFHSAIFLYLAALLPVGRWLSPTLATCAALALPPAYLFLATRETFAADRAEAAWKSALVLAAYSLLLAIALTAVLVLAIMRR